MLKSLRAKRHSLEGPKNLPSAFEDGAQSGVALRPRSLILELGLLSVWTACVRRRQGNGVVERNPAQKAWFLAAPENPAQPAKSSFTSKSWSFVFSGTWDLFLSSYVIFQNLLLLRLSLSSTLPYRPSTSRQWGHVSGPGSGPPKQPRSLPLPCPKQP